MSWREPCSRVEYASADPLGVSLNTKPRVTQLFGAVGDSGPGWNALGVVGNSGEYVTPPTYALPLASTAMASPASGTELFDALVIPDTVPDQTRAEPVVFNLAMKTPLPDEPISLICTAPGVTGKSSDCVVPVT